MLVAEGCPSELRRKRENGSWGLQSSMSYKDSGTGKRVEKVTKSEGGSFPPEEVVMETKDVGSVGTSRGLTINMGNYQSARIDVWCSLPTDLDHLEDNYKKCDEFCNTKVTSEAAEIQKLLDKQKEG